MHIFLNLTITQFLGRTLYARLTAKCRRSGKELSFLLEEDVSVKDVEVIGHRAVIGDQRSKDTQVFYMLTAMVELNKLNEI
ncbi:hypothetical protein J6590_086354 [Homalodisca vitripennis]|nr:hypothetical protein J6590_086354 [Homalodisca vitripennis]